MSDNIFVKKKENHMLFSKSIHIRSFSMLQYACEPEIEKTHQFQYHNNEGIYLQSVCTHTSHKAVTYLEIKETIDRSRCPRLKWPFVCLSAEMI